MERFLVLFIGCHLIRGAFQNTSMWSSVLSAITARLARGRRYRLIRGLNGTGAFIGQFVEGAAALGVHRIFAREGLPAPNCDIDITRLDLHGVGDAPDA